MRPSGWLTTTLLAPALLLGACQNRPAQQAAAPPARTAPDAALRNTRWVPRTLAGQPVAPPADGNGREPYLLLRADSAAEGNGACNRFRGRYTVPGPGQLTFGPLLSTRMACPALPTETAFLKALEQTRTYQLRGDTLRLLGADHAPLARLEAVYLR
ncbi:MAG: META domain-containing protein [Janthinobacterium lividum]